MTKLPDLFCYGGVAELPAKNLSKSLNFHKLRLFYIHKI